MEVWPQIIAGKVCRTEVLPRPRSFRRGSVPAHCRGRRPRRPAILFPEGIFRVSERGSLFPAATCRLFPCMPPAGNVPRPRARVTFGRSPKSDQKVCLKPQVSRLPARLGYVKNLSPRTPRKPKYMLIVIQRIACTSLPAAAPVFRAAMRWFIGFAAACWHAVLQNALRSSAYFFIFRGPTGRTCTCCQRRQVRDLIIAYIGRPTDFPCPPRQRQRG